MMASGVAVIGIGTSRLGAARTDVSLQELIFEGATAALQNAKLSREQIDSVVISASDLVDGRGIASMSSAAAAGAYMKHETRTTNDGLYALILAALEILAGRSKIALVSAWNKVSEVQWSAAAPTFFEPFYDRPVGLNDLGMMGLEAGQMMLRDPADRLLFTQAVLRNHSNSRGNGIVPARAKIDERSIEQSPMVSWPLTEGDLPVPCDAAISLVLADAETAAQLCGNPIYVEGFAWASGAATGIRDLADSRLIGEVAARAYREAGINALSDVGVVELVAKCSAEELLILDGLVRPLGGNGRNLIREGSTLRGGSLPVNLSGGTNGIYPGQAAGLWAASQTVAHLNGTSNGESIAVGKFGVTHSQSGPALQNNAVAVFAAHQRSN